MTQRRWQLFLELNMHFVNSHFMHPDDLLMKTEERLLGWKTEKAADEYMTWLK